MGDPKRRKPTTLQSVGSIVLLVTAAASLAILPGCSVKDILGDEYFIPPKEIETRIDYKDTGYDVVVEKFEKQGTDKLLVEGHINPGTTVESTTKKLLVEIAVSMDEGGGPKYDYNTSRRTMACTPKNLSLHSYVKDRTREAWEHPQSELQLERDWRWPPDWLPTSPCKGPNHHFTVATSLPEGASFSPLPPVKGLVVCHRPILFDQIRINFGDHAVERSLHLEFPEVWFYGIPWGTLLRFIDEHTAMLLVDATIESTGKRVPGHKDYVVTPLDRLDYAGLRQRLLLGLAADGYPPGILDDLLATLDMKYVGTPPYGATWKSPYTPALLPGYRYHVHVSFSYPGLAFEPVEFDIAPTEPGNIHKQVVVREKPAATTRPAGQSF